MKKHFPILIIGLLLVTASALGLLTSCDNANAAPMHTTTILDTVTISLNGGGVQFRTNKGSTQTWPRYSQNNALHYYLTYDTTGADTFKLMTLEGSIVYKSWPVALWYVKTTTPNSTVGNSFNVQNFVNWTMFFTAGGSDTIFNLTAAQRDSLKSWNGITTGQTIYNTALDSLQYLKASGSWITIH